MRQKTENWTPGKPLSSASDCGYCPCSGTIYQHTLFLHSDAQHFSAFTKEHRETGKFASDRLQPFKSSTPLSDSYIRTQCCCTVTIRRHCFVGTHLLSYDTEPVVSTNVCRISLANFRHRYIFILIGVFHQRYYTEKEDVVNMDTQSIGEIRA